MPLRRNMSNEQSYITIGEPADNIDVLLSYRIVELFSEGLYASPNKAIEELVANSFDAGAQTVLVQLSTNLHHQDATIVVIDDGEGMDDERFKQHWLIGASNKRVLNALPKGRQQIGQFGIGKLATYVLSRRLSHVSKCNRKYYAASMDYTEIEATVNKQIQPTNPIRIVLRELTESQAQTALKNWTDTPVFKQSGLALFGAKAGPSWTVSIMSSLKPKVHEIRPGTLEWVLRTALPLRPDFGIWLNGKKLVSSKQDKNLIKRLVLGNDIVTLPKPAPKGITAYADANVPIEGEHHFGLEVPVLGRITGYTEAYSEPLQGKSDLVGRSNGFFVYVRGRLINVDDGHFGIDPDELRHGTFSRFRAVVNIDGLDEELRSSRESVREGPRLEAARDTLRALFNFVRPTIDKHDDEETPGAKLSRKLASSPASLSRQPIVDLARAVVQGKFKSRYLIVPKHKSEEDREAFLATLQERAENPTKFVSGLTIDYTSTSEVGIAQYETATGIIRINAWHPFVATFHDEFTNKTSRAPLELISLAEVLAEAHLHGLGVKQEHVTDFLALRDQLLRNLADESGRQSAFAVAIALQNARNNPDLMEEKLCSAFTSLGFEVISIGGNGKPDGVATALISGQDDGGKPLKYAVSLDSKSKESDEKKVSAGSVKVSTIARHRNEYKCQHALVVGRAFPTTQGDKSALAKEIADDRSGSAAKNDPRTITLITIDTLAELVKLRPIKQVGLRKLRELFVSCSLPEECEQWVAKIASTNIQKPPYKAIIETIALLQKKKDRLPVKYSVLLNELGHRDPPIDYDTEEPLIDLCKAMAQMAPGAVFANASTVELDQSTTNVMDAIEAATKEYEESK